LKTGGVVGSTDEAQDPWNFYLIYTNSVSEKSITLESVFISYFCTLQGIIIFFGDPHYSHTMNYLNNRAILNNN